MLFHQEEILGQIELFETESNRNVKSQDLWLEFRIMVVFKHFQSKYYD